MNELKGWCYFLAFNRGLYVLFFFVLKYYLYNINKYYA
jgi:hypothetical protein